jgi:hypothetical protein
MRARVAVAVLGVLASVAAACGPTDAPAERTRTSPSPGLRSGPVTASPTMDPMAFRGPSIELRGTFEEWTDFPCHRSDPFVGNETVRFRGSDGSTTTVVIGSANWIGRPADPPKAPLGQCHQVAPFSVTLPRAHSYVVEINDRELTPVTLATLRTESFRHRFVLP